MDMNIINEIIVSPLPKRWDKLEEKLILTSKVNIKGEEIADKDALRVLNEFLVEKNIVKSEEFHKSFTTITIGERNNIFEETSNLNDLDKELQNQGYFLTVNKINNEITIYGNDKVGTFYGVQTLKQLIEVKDNRVLVKVCTIVDYPSMKNRGIVEGFYGKPWTHEQRLKHLEFYGENKLNMYIYAPKSDPYHREKWREPYPENELQRMHELIEKSKVNKIDFVFAISPGIDIKFDGEDGEKDYKELLNKCESLYGMGVRSFAIYWDDIEDKSGEKQATVLNNFNKDFIHVKEGVTPLITVPTEYCSNGMIKEGKILEYTKDFSETLDKDIEVMWTGIEVVPEGISLENAKLVREVFGKKLAIWWNYPVSDYYEKKLALGPICNLDNSLAKEVQIFTMNPMRFAETSKIALYTGADYGWNPEQYDYNKSWDNAMRKLYGNISEEFKYFANHSTRMDAGWAKCGREDAPGMKVLINNLWSKIDNKEDISEDIDILYNEFNKVIDISSKLTDLLPVEVKEECIYQIERFGLVGKCAKLALDIVVVTNNNDKESWNTLNEALTKQIEEIKIGPKVSEKVLVEFIKEASDRGRAIFKKEEKDKESNIELKYKVSTDIIAKKSNNQSFVIDNIVNDKLDNVFESQDNIDMGNYIEIDLGEVYEVNNVKLLQGENVIIGRLQYSTNGANWIDICSCNRSDDYIANELKIQARYIKYTAIEKLDFTCCIKEFRVITI